MVNKPQCRCNCGFTCTKPGEPLWQCGLEMMDCIEQHWRRDCDHDFQSGPWVELPDGGTSSCKCEATSMSHDMAVGP